MKTKTFFTALLAIVLLSAAQCEKPDNSKLPPETQEGKNTFGCLINGELFTGFSKPVQIGLPPLTAYYYRSRKELSIYAAKYEGAIGLRVENPKENTTATINSAGFAPYDDICSCFYYRKENTGQVILSKFDTVNLIVSGRFYFDGQCSDIDFKPIGDSIIYVTDGRFDIKLDIYE